jgi:hypothetical protein
VDGCGSFLLAAARRAVANYFGLHFGIMSHPTAGDGSE